MLQRDTSQSTGHIHNDLPFAAFYKWEVGLSDASGAADVYGHGAGQVGHGHRERGVVFQLRAWIKGRII